MPLIDSNIYQNAPQSILRYALNGYDNAMRSNDAALQRQDAASQRRDAETQRKLEEAKRRRDQEFQQNLSGLMGSYGEYGHTPEGQRDIFDRMAKAGYAKEMIGLMGGVPEIQKQKPPEYDFREGSDGLYATNKSDPNQSIKVPGFTPKDEKPKSERYQLVKNRKGQMESVDVSTGLNSKGQPVDAWVDPQKPDVPNANNVFTQEQQLRSQYLSQTKDFRDVRDAFGRIQTSAKDPSAAGDLSLIFNYMKMLDPGSTVREGEFANAQNAGGVPERIWSSYNKLKNGERLAPSQRADFLSQAKKLYAQADFQKKKTMAGYRKIAGQYPGINPDRVLIDDAIAEEQQAQPETNSSAQQTQVAQPKSKAERDALPPGTKYIGPDGKMATKQ